jgi:ACT domain-containing protein
MRAIVTVVGQDRVGIIAAVCTELAAQKINILDISQTVLNGCFTMVMLVDTVLCETPFADLAVLLEANGSKIDLTVRIQREDIFNAMHRI